MQPITSGREPSIVFVLKSFCRSPGYCLLGVLIRVFSSQSQIYLVASFIEVQERKLNIRDTSIIPHKCQFYVWIDTMYPFFNDVEEDSYIFSCCTNFTCFYEEWAWRNFLYCLKLRDVCKFYILHTRLHILPLFPE